MLRIEKERRERRQSEKRSEPKEKRGEDCDLKGLVESNAKNSDEEVEEAVNNGQVKINVTIRRREP